MQENQIINDKKMKFWLADIKSIDNLKEKFIEDWNWDNSRQTRYTFTFPDDIKTKIGEVIGIAEKSDYQVLFFNLINLTNPARELKSIENKIIRNSEVRQIVNNSIFIFAHNDFEYLDFVNAEKIGQAIKIKRFSVTPENRDKLRTPSEQLDKLKLTSYQDAYQVRMKIEEAFSVEVVTEKFYDEYIKVFKAIQKSLFNQKDIIGKEKKLRDYIHQVLNRLMFLYFVQKRGCFNNDKNFLANFWDKYKTVKILNNEFHKNWLEVLFFEALSKPSRSYSSKQHMGEYDEILKNAPYLNGGLFERNDLDNIGWLISDELFDRVFEFFESYNFTVEESTPFDIDIAINPEMLGNVYEHLVNTEEQEEQARAGIFYTPKVEIELMVRRSLVEFIYNKLRISKDKLYQFIFKELDKELDKKIICPFDNKEAGSILKELDEILILDPACGSGHYLVVTAQILYELKEALWQCLEKKHSGKYEAKKQIIERNIYGNDIKEWAVEVAKLRLWLDLFVDADIDRLKNQQDPILPNLNFKIRCGDSLVQRIGKDLVSLRSLTSIIKNRTNDIKALIDKKKRVYRLGKKEDNDAALKLEKKLLLNAISDDLIRIEKKIKEIEKSLNQLGINFDNETDYKKINGINKDYIKLEEDKKALELTYRKISETYKEVSRIDPDKTPMIWDLAFAEVFAMKNGFDIVIANPPYVRQEKIEDLLGHSNKSEYKERLIEQTKRDWSIDYEGKQIKSLIPERFDKKCDLYIYFYLKGLKLLNEDGVMCYISSNSWLDVGYGKILQQVLLKSVPIIAIYDNQVKRSFAHADVNTIIAILKAPILKDADESIKNNDVRFVMLKKQFEEILYSALLLELENNDNLKVYPEGKRKENENYRLHIINQKELYEFGKNKDGAYEGNKWGGKYLRAPEIYWKIMEKGKDKLVRLGDIAEVRFGIKTGANEFFYVEDVTDKINDISQIRQSIKNLGSYKTLDEIKKAVLRIVQNTKTKDYWLIEEEFLKPVIKSPRECKTILIKPEDLKFKVFMCHKSKKELKGTKALDYIEWGENCKVEIKRGSEIGKKIKGYRNLATIVNRNKWYDLGRWEISKNVLPMFERTRKYCFFNNKSYIDAALYWVYLINNTKDDILCLNLNSTLFGLWKELLARPPEGGGGGPIQIKVYNYDDMFIVRHNFLLKYEEKLRNIFNCFINREIKSIFEELGFDPNKPIREQEPNPLPDRKALDDIVFDVLGLTEEERKEVYWAVAELVKNRLEKAKSV